MPEPSSPSSPSRWLGWTVALVAMPVVYLLTTPPIVCLLGLAWSRGWMPTSSEWVTTYALPYDWLCEESPMGESLLAYAAWWANWFVVPYGSPSP